MLAPSGKADLVFVDKVADTGALTMGSINLITSEAVVDMIQVNLTMYEQNNVWLFFSRRSKRKFGP